MAVTAQLLKNIMAEARPIIERQMNDAKLIAGFRDVVASNGGDWGALKALIKAHVEDENDETGEGKRVQKIRDKADSTSAYADMLGLANMNENNFSAEASYAEATGREPTVREIEKVQPETANLRAGPQYSAVPGGEPSIPSSDDGGAKTEDRANDLPGRSDDKSVTHYSQSEQAAKSNSDEGIPAFLKRDRKPLRPNCMNPDSCAGYGSHTCHSCTVAAREVEPA